MSQPSKKDFINELYWKKLDKWTPHKLTERNKIIHLAIVNSLINRNRNDTFIDRIVTCDEKWIDYNNSSRSGKWVTIGKPSETIPKKNVTQRSF